MPLAAAIAKFQGFHSTLNNSKLVHLQQIQANQLRGWLFSFYNRPQLHELVCCLRSCTLNIEAIVSFAIEVNISISTRSPDWNVCSINCANDICLLVPSVHVLAWFCRTWKVDICTPHVVDYLSSDVMYTFADCWETKAEIIEIIP